MEQADALGKQIQDGLKVRNAREHAHVGVIIALVDHGYIARDGNNVITVVDGVQTTILTDTRPIITAAARGRNIVLLFDDGDLLLVGHESVHVDFTLDDVYDTVNDVYLVNIIVAADRPEAAVVVADTVLWVRFGCLDATPASGAAHPGALRILDIEPGAVIAFHCGAVCAVSPTLKTAITFSSEGDSTCVNAAVTVPAHGEWKFAVSCDSHFVIATETSVLVYTAAFELKTVYRIFGPADAIIVNSKIYIATLLGELLCVPLSGGPVVSCDHIPSIHLNMRINYDAGSVLCKITDATLLALACNTRKLYGYQYACV